MFDTTNEPIEEIVARRWCGAPAGIIVSLIVAGIIILIAAT